MNDHQGLIFDLRRETEEERRANLSFETAISGTFRSQSHQELNPELIRSEKPLWKVSYFFGLGFFGILVKCKDWVRSEVPERFYFKW